MSDALQLEEVAAFLAVIESGGFTSAARALGVSKSTVSRRVSHLETKLGARLLSRTTRAVTPTEVGAAYHRRVARAVADMNDAAESVRELNEEPRGHLRVTAPVDLGRTSATLMVDFIRRYPEITVELELTQRTIDLVGEGFDVALRVGHLADSTLVAQRISEVAIELFASPVYLARRGTPLSPDELDGHDWVLFRATGRQSWTLHGPGGHERTITAVGQLSANDFGFVRDATVAGVGIGAMPRIACAQAVRSGELVSVLPGWQTPSRPIQIVYPGARFLSAKVRVFRDFAREFFREQCTTEVASAPEEPRRRERAGA